MSDKNKSQPLHMFLTGPGGTGKPHIISALHLLMTIYGGEHKLHFLSPIGSAASLIDGMTIHNAKYNPTKKRKVIMNLVEAQKVIQSL